MLDPWGSVEIAGWRKSIERTAAFYFTDLGDSYAARTGRPQNVGVIGVAVFQEKSEANRLSRAGPARPPGCSEAGAAAGAQGRARGRATGLAAGAGPGSAGAGASDAASPDELRGMMQDGARTLGKLGTGHGRSEESRGDAVVTFERATATPAETVAIQLRPAREPDRDGRAAAAGPPIARARPNPFPGALRFAPDPGR